MATVNKIDIAGLEGNEAAQPRVFAHAAGLIILTGLEGVDAFVYVVPNTNAVPNPGDGNTVQKRGACIYIGGAGNLDVELESGDRVIFKGLTAGSFLPILVTKVFATDKNSDATTTATDIIALF